MLVLNASLLEPCKFWQTFMEHQQHLHTQAHYVQFLTTDRIINALACLINIKSQAGVNTLRCYA